MVLGSNTIVFMAEEIITIKVTNSDLVLVGKAAKEIGVIRNTIYVWLREKKITGIQIGGRQFIPKSEVERLKKTVAK